MIISQVVDTFKGQSTPLRFVLLLAEKGVIYEVCVRRKKHEN